MILETGSRKGLLLQLTSFYQLLCSFGREQETRGMADQR